MADYIDEHSQYTNAGEAARAEMAGLRAELARLRDAHRWIPVGERLPVNGQWVLCQYFGPDGNGLPHKASWDGDDWHVRTGGGSHVYYGRNRFTHWIPLPPDPEEANAAT